MKPLVAAMDSHRWSQESAQAARQAVPRAAQAIRRREVVHHREVVGHMEVARHM